MFMFKRKQIKFNRYNSVTSQMYYLTSLKHCFLFDFNLEQQLVGIPIVEFYLFISFLPFIHLEITKKKKKKKKKKRSFVKNMFRPKIN
ncbi:hypothetical protein KUTeg_018781 [Tegillarca granosa]|uniref:Uncharacterized protein n=1 Tax=Tegillarca granosa TaxID=220873 RepID=A0ABQ9EIH5_TEGGR|nr:hypothetical protein KUTeg_018781 [Tegillarca granosa]